MKKRFEDNHQGQSASQKVEDKLKVCIHISLEIYMYN